MSEFDDILAELKQKRDELRLQMHLASREIAEEWDELEEKMEKLTTDAKLSETVLARPLVSSVVSSSSATSESGRRSKKIEPGWLR